jgi:Arc/MetJ-type ribon-helix-helix transcriptional regulator/RNA polymerase subunit RPABC4/transcription elongation factor Spt4
MMSKITFRADDDLVRRLEEFDSSKSEVMREALRAYLDSAGRETEPADEGSIDDALAARVDALIAERLDERLRGGAGVNGPQDVNVNISVEGVPADHRVNGASDADADERKTTDVHTEDGMQTVEAPCGQCGEIVASDHVYCPNCGEKRAQLAFCECGEELRSDWAFCPDCGRRTPAADVLDRP